MNIEEDDKLIFHIILMKILDDFKTTLIQTYIKSKI